MPVFFLLMILMFFPLTLQNSGETEKMPAEKPVTFTFADEQTGWAAGLIKTGGVVKNPGDSSLTNAIGKQNVYKTMLLKTTDGGQSWFLQTVLQSADERIEIRDLFALDARHCWVVATRVFADKTFILATTDGQTWKAMNFTEDITPKQIFFTDALNGWMIGSALAQADELFRTNDGGKTWKSFSTGFQGTFHSLRFSGNKGYLLANLVSSPENLTILKTSDGGDIWISALEAKADAGYNLVGTNLQMSHDTVYVLAKSINEDSDEYGNSVLIYSSDGFASSETRRVTYEKDTKINETLVGNFSIQSGQLIGVDLVPSDYFASATQEFASYNLITSDDEGKTWTKIAEFNKAVYHFMTLSASVALCSSGDGEIFYSANSGRNWTLSSVNFRNYFLKPPSVALQAQADGMESDALAYGDEWDELARDTTYSSRWESADDSLLALSFSNNVDVTKYKADVSKKFSVGIDTVASSIIVFDKRIRRGAKHGIWDLLKEEARTGEIKIRKYKTLRFAGEVHAVDGKRPVKFSWSSSINGELSDQLSFTTQPRQLFPGTHFIFFKAMDENGQWSNPVVVKVVVEDFPKYKFPFQGAWTAGGGGSYYNKGWHIRGIRYALDLNNTESNEGSDGDYGLPVRASTDGVVAFAGYMRGYGRTVKIDYMYGGHKYTTLVSHLATISVDIGETVKQGQELGTCGTTGRSSAPHVHWELRVDDICQAPEPVFENDSTAIQTVYNGGTFNSDNYYQPPYIVVVDEPQIPNTWFERRGYYHSYRWVNVTKSLKTVEVKWKPKLPRSGDYKVQVHIPKKYATAMATYEVHNKNGVQSVKVNQNKFTDEWVTLGTYAFDADDDVYVYTSNATGQSKGTIAFDAVRFIGQWEKEQVGLTK
ncbi:peptidoglycan DD-metalloendopeptidase family protein [bacterium]|nr:peptidoglycan DD-metalloendopeptidase family protein [bacterium]